MIVGIGTDPDLVEIERIKKPVKKRLFWCVYIQKKSVGRLEMRPGSPAILR